jgi:hypothetical protein
MQIVPILLPEGQLTMLRTFGFGEAQVLDLTAGTADAWAAGVNAIRSLMETPERHASRLDALVPYVGANPYTEDDARFFAGREDETERLYESVQTNEAVFVTGPAKVGKTSLINAGFLPRLRHEGLGGARFGMSSRWDATEFDWSTPFPALPTATLPGTTEPYRVFVIDGADTFLVDGQEAAVQKRVDGIVEAIKQGKRSGYKIVVVWRDVFDESRRQAILNAAAATGTVGHVTIERLAGEAERRAIEQPALRAGHLLEPGLAQRLVESAGGASNAIMQMQLALAAIWPLRQRGWLTNKNLDDVGHLGGVFQKHITQALGTLSPEKKRGAEAMFKSLVTLDNALKLVPMPQYWKTLATVPALVHADPVVLRDTLATLGLIDLRRVAVLTVLPGDTGMPYRETDVKIDLVRPNAMAYFGGGEVIPDVRFFMWRGGQFGTDLGRWIESRRSRDRLLTGTALAEAQDWLGLRSIELSTPEREFINASVALRDSLAAPEGADPVQQELERAGGAELEKTAQSELMIQVGSALSRGDFLTAKGMLIAICDRAIKAAPDRPLDPYIVQRLVLATYKSKHPTELAALREALEFLAPLEPDTTNDPETLGLSAAIHKRLWPLTDDIEHLNQAVRACDRGFSVSNDYYNGVNLAFLLNERAVRSRNPADAVTDFVVAERVRREVVAICDKWLAENAPAERASAEAKRQNADTRYWVMATRAEALVALGDTAAARALDAVYAAAPQAWMADSTRAQIEKLQVLLRDSPLKYLEGSGTSSA